MPPQHFDVVTFDAKNADPSQDLPLLSAEEIARMEGFFDPVHGRNWAYFRAATRRVLGVRLGMPPERVPITLAPGGKPAVPGIEFSLTHCGPNGALALSTVPIGIDLERRDRHMAGRDKVARRVMTEGEFAGYIAAPSAEQTRIFFDIWTAKEAVTKALGTGLATPLLDIEVSINGSALLAVPGGVSGWSLRRINLGPDLSTAVALKGPAGGAWRL